jgi:hypothetical protein
VHLLVPALLIDSPLHDHALDGARLPWLERIVARAAHADIAADGLEAALCDLLGIARQTDWPIAPIALLADGVDPGAPQAFLRPSGGTERSEVSGEAPFWLRADPVHLALRRDQVAILPVDELDAEEAAVLVQALNEHFPGEATFLAPHPLRWYVRLASPATVRTTPPSLAYGRDLARMQPQGETGARLRALMSEVQILLHNHPLNAQREARGANPINGVWPWGGGVLPARPAPPNVRLHARHPDALALGRFVLGAASASTLADAVPACAGMTTCSGAPQAEDVVVLGDLAEAAASGDPERCRDTLLRLDATLFAPLWKRGEPLVIDDPLAGRRLTLSRWQRWRVWKRPRPLRATAPLPTFAAGGPVANGNEASVDEFGNRF